MTVTAPYGTWISPVTPDLMTGRTIGLSGLAVDGDALYWLEARPGEGGRSALIRWTEAAGAAELTPAPHDVGSRVHEYGGGAFAVADGVVVFSDRRDGSVWLIEDAAPPRRITANPGCRYADFAFDPVRRRVLAVREDHRGQPANAPNSAVVALDPAAGEASEVVLAEGPDFLSSPRLSPDGTRLAWIEWDHPDMPWDATRLMVASLDAAGQPGTPTLIAGETREAILEPRWLDQSRLMFSTDRTGWWTLHVWAGDKAVPVAPVAPEIGGPAWQFATRHYTPLADGRIAAARVVDGRRRAVLLDRDHVTALPLGAVTQAPLPFRGGFAAITTPPDAPPAVVLTEARDGPVTAILRTAGPDVLAPGDIAQAEAIRFPTADGLFAHGFFYKPRNSGFTGPAEALPPLIVLGHGGPTSMAADGFALGIQWWTTRGFAVVDVNYRGSAGFGRDYRRQLDGNWGVADVADCIAAAQYLAAEARVDAGRIAIRGGSAGGFTVLAALTRSTVFRAGASLYGIGDLALLASDTHKFESRYLDRLVGPLPEAASIYRERSPLYHLDRFAAPAIFFQGLEDRVVPPNQAETMVEAMAARGLPVAYYTFAGEGHGFRKAETIRRVLELELGFYGRIFGFTPPGLSEAVVIRNLP